MFDVKQFVHENKDLVKKYLKKNTYDVIVPDILPQEKQLYKGNATVAGYKYTPEFELIHKLEYIKCARNIEYFSKKYIRIVSIDEGIIPFKPYDFQTELLNKYADNRYVICMQGRQTGKSTTTAIFLIWYAIFHSSKTIAVLANKEAQAKEILTRIRLAYEYLPFFIKGHAKTYNKKSMVLGNNSEIFAAATGSTAIRGRSISVLYLDEFHFVQNDVEFYESVYPTISSGLDSRVIITSTPNGTRGVFYKIWKESEEGSNRFVNHKVYWHEIPWRTEKWKEETIANTSAEQFEQEHNLSFRGSVDSLIPGHVLSALPFRKRYKIKNEIKIFEEPKIDKKYFITVDTSRGVGGDYSAFVVFDITELPYKVVATYKNNRISPLVYPGIIHNTAQRYNNAHVLVEINDIGGEVANLLFYDYEYENLLPTVTEKSKQVLGYGSNRQLGVRTTKAVKSIGCSNVKTMIENSKLKLNDYDIIDEFGNFVVKGAGYEAAQGAHDDLVMCCVLLAWSSSQTYFQELSKGNLIKNLQSDYEVEMMPFGIIDSPSYDDVDMQLDFEKYDLDEGLIDNLDVLNGF